MFANDSMRTWCAFGVPKRGNRTEEYEDAHAGDPATGRFAIADGASESSFAGAWARLLVEQFVREGAPAPDQFPVWLAPLRRAWAAEIDGLSLPWYAEEKAQQGSFATFLGLELGPSSEGGAGSWKAVALGDSCLFQFRDGELLHAFPVGKSTDFGNQPPLVGSRPGPLATLAQLAGEWQTGDDFWLMTDALAEWFLRRMDVGVDPRTALLNFLSKSDVSEFNQWVDHLRDTENLRNDDVTLIGIRFD